MEKVEVVDLKGLEGLAKGFCKNLTRSYIVLLSGEMGVGKTQFVRFMVQCLHGDCDVVSPTFSIHNSYVCKGCIVEHFDFHRLKSMVDLESTGFWDVLSLAVDEEDLFRVVVVEWPNLLKGVRLSLPLVEICMYYTDSERRKVSIAY